LVNWARAKSLWIFPFGGYACAAADRSARSPVQTGGFYDTYTQIQDIGRFVPVAAYVPGCPPRIEDLIDAIEGLQRKISRNG
jgi:NADH:ubiquinone oxidoreductase subunit B-like Fe-S oxidoreductase